MLNSLVFDRRRFDTFSLFRPYGERNSAIPFELLFIMDFIIIEEEDGSATFLKNRYNDQKKMTFEEYESFKTRMYKEEKNFWSNAKFGELIYKYTEDEHQDVTDILDSFK